MKVCFLHKIPGEAKAMIEEAGHGVVYGRENIVGADAVLSLLTDKIDGAFMDEVGPRLKIIANYAVGFDNIDLAAAGKRNIFVTNTPDVLTQAVAEHTFTLILSVSRRIVAADKYIRAGKYHQWEPDLFIGTQLKGKTLGIVGLGRIGSTVAKIAHFGFEMSVCYHTHKVEEELDQKLNSCFYDNLEAMLPEVDILTLHVPLTEKTTHMIGKKELSAMKKTAILINTARGAIVDEQALIAALKQGWIAGAGLDVFEEESPGSTVNHELITINNVVLTPHIASATLEARTAMSRLAAENIITALSGKTPPNLAS